MSKFLIVLIALLASLSLSLSLSLLLLRFLNRLRNQSPTTITSAESASTASASASISSTTATTRGSSLLDSLPLFKFSSINRRSSSTVDCAVCISKFEPPDLLRLLPLCCHAFHADCVDKWLQFNQTCPLCRSPIQASDSDIIKALSSSGGGQLAESFRLEIGSISSHRRAAPDSAVSTEQPQRSSYFSVGSFEYVVDEESEITLSQTRRMSVPEMDESPAAQPSLAAEVAAERSWLRLISASISPRSMSFQFSGRLRRQNQIHITDQEPHSAGEQIKEMFQWISEV